MPPRSLPRQLIGAPPSRVPVVRGNGYHGYLPTGGPKFGKEGARPYEQVLILSRAFAALDRINQER